MSAPQGLAWFPGVERLVDASLTLQEGISPSVAHLKIVPQADLSTEVGTLVFTFGDVTIEFPECKVDRGSLDRNAQGEVCELSLFDRRWKWRFGRISGTYNARRDNFGLRRGENNTIDTERTPQELATLCLEAMGETDFDVADLPNESRPSVEWDCDVPAKALASLCDQLGCHVVLQLDNRVAICRAGQGADLPAAAAINDSANIDVPERPDAIVVLGGATRFQVDFQLEAVGMAEGDAQAADTLRPIDELSYKPAGGWSTADVPYFHQVDAKFRGLARKSVFRYYRIKTPVDVPGYEGPDGRTVKKLEQLLPIEDEQIAVADENGQLANAPAIVFGVWFADTGGVANCAASLTPAAQAVEGDGGASLASVIEKPFTIDAARGLVIFDEPLYRNAHASATGGSGYEVVPGPAELVLRAACNVRDAKTMAVEQYTRERASGANLGTPKRYLKHRDIVLTHRPKYSASYAVESVDTNADAAHAEADHYLDIAEREYQTNTPRTVQFVGLLRIDVDGAIRRVEFHVGASGTTTRAVRNDEHPRDGMSYSERRRIERQREADEAALQARPRHLARALKSNLHARPRPKS